MSGWSLRSASPEDRDWLWRLHADTMRDSVEATWGWDEAYQQARFHRALDLEAIRILVVEGRDAGVLWLEDRGLDLFLARLEVHPEHQGRGLGTAVIAHLLDRAGAEGRALRLLVLKTNRRALSLYLRLGLEISSDSSTHWRMSSTTSGQI